MDLSSLNAQCLTHEGAISELKAKNFGNLERIRKIEDFLWDSDKGMASRVDNRLKRIEAFLLTMIGLLIGLGIITAKNIWVLESLTAVATKR